MAAAGEGNAKERGWGVFKYIAFSSFSFIVQDQVQGLGWMRLEKKYDHRSLLTPSHLHPGHEAPGRTWVLPFFLCLVFVACRAAAIPASPNPAVAAASFLVLRGALEMAALVALRCMCAAKANGVLPPGQNVRSSVPWQPKAP